MSAELRMLQEQTQQLALTLAQIGDALKALNARLDTADQEAQKRFADQKLLIQKLSDDVSAIRERTQDTDTRLRKLAEEVEALRSTITSLPSLLSSARAGAVSGTRRRSIRMRPAPAAASTGAAAVDRRALAVAHAGHRARATTSPGRTRRRSAASRRCSRPSRRSEAAAEAQFMLGETYSQQKRCSDAVTAYTAVIQNFPRSMWVPEAYYKRGKAQERSDSPTPHARRTSSCSRPIRTRRAPDSPSRRSTVWGVRPRAATPVATLVDRTVEIVTFPVTKTL